MNLCAAYANRRTKKEDVEVDILSESIGDVRSAESDDLSTFSQPRHESMFSDTDVVTELSLLHENFVKVSADQASCNYSFVKLCIQERWCQNPGRGT